jgi:histone-lysine N-methyltransferase SETMAR
VDDIATHLDISHGSAHHIISDVLQYHKVSARWVPRQLTPELKQRRIDACQELLRRFETEGGGFLSRIVTGDETWVHYHEPETKRASKEWRHPSSPKPKKFRTQPSAGKVMLTLFWDERGVILEHYMPRGNTVTRATYTELLRNHLRPAIKSKRRGLLSKGVLLQHDNARPHTAHATTETIEALHFQCLPHPPYSPDLAPSDFHLFGRLKEALGGKTFRSDEEVQQVVHEWLHTRPREFFSTGIQALHRRWKTCIERNGGYVEK